MSELTGSVSLPLDVGTLTRSAIYYRASSRFKWSRQGPDIPRQELSPPSAGRRRNPSLERVQYKWTEASENVRHIRVLGRGGSADVHEVFVPLHLG